VIGPHGERVIRWIATASSGWAADAETVEALDEYRW
jgi:hypothetical protein